MSFTGEYRAKLNAKHQVTLPSPLREAIFQIEKSTPLILFSRVEGAFLELYPAVEWEVIQNKTEILARQEKKPELNRMLNARAFPIHLDEKGNGRILIPQLYAKTFKPSDEVVFIGNTKKIELWNEKEFNRHLNKAKSSFDDVMEDIFDY